jgi:tetraacyldisaccharide 4'-kinase
VLSLVEALRHDGLSPHIVMRGHGGRRAGPLRVDPATHDAEAVGDEALLAAPHAPTWIARDRAAGVRAAAAAGAPLILLDDGFQNPSVAKDLSLLVVDAGYGFGNGRLLPAGPLRERVDAGLARADAIVLLDGDPARMPPELADGNRPILHAELAPCGTKRYAGERVVAFAGIGRPEKFFAMLRRLGANVVAECAFSDHHPFSPGEIAALRKLAERENALLVTTEKDRVRLPDDFRIRIDVLRVEIRWRDRQALRSVLAPVLAACGIDEFRRRSDGG